MPLSIFSNAASVDAQIRLGKTQEMTANTMSKLASGLRIASVSDDPAGLGVSMVFDTQVRSYSQASRNTNDGLSLLQTTDGALSQVHGALQRMRELAVNSANGTLSNTDRVNLQTEFSQLQSEIDRIATSTRFGNISLLAAKQTTSGGWDATGLSDVSYKECGGDLYVYVDLPALATTNGWRIARTDDRRPAVGGRVLAAGRRSPDCEPEAARATGRGDPPVGACAEWRAGAGASAGSAAGVRRGPEVGLVLELLAGGRVSGGDGLGG